MSSGWMPPYTYDTVNVITSGQHQQNIHTHDTWVYHFFKRNLLNRAMSVFKWDIPQNWAENYLNYCVWGMGFAAVINTRPYGVIPTWCTLSGYNVMYQPNKIYVANPAFAARELVIDQQCTILRLQPDWGSIMDVVDYYANMLAIATETVNINMFNSHVAFVFGCDGKNAAKSAKDMYDQIARGEPAVFPDQQLYNKAGEKTWELFNRDVKSTYISNLVLDDIRKILNMFDTELGIPNNASAKRERQIVDEVNANNVETYTKMDMFLDTLKKGCEKTREMFNIQIDIDWRFPLQLGGVDSAAGGNVGAGTVQLG